MEDYKFVHNGDRNRFELHLPDGDIALIAYRPFGDDTLALYHTEVPYHYEGKGVGTQLAQKTLEACKADNKMIIPVCSFVKTYIRRHPEWLEIVREA